MLPSSGYFDRSGYHLWIICHVNSYHVSGWCPRHGWDCWEGLCRFGWKVARIWHWWPVYCVWVEGHWLTGSEFEVTPSERETNIWKQLLIYDGCFKQSLNVRVRAHAFMGTCVRAYMRERWVSFPLSISGAALRWPRWWTVPLLTGARWNLSILRCYHCPICGLSTNNGTPP